MSSADPARELLRHTVATLAYRGGKAVRGAPPGFSGFRAGAGTRSAGEVLAHIGDLLDWAVAQADGDRSWKPISPSTWDADSVRFFSALEKLDARLASDTELGTPAEKLFQGPIADALTHTGQINLMRRLAGAPVRGENYVAADIAAGRVGADQAAPRREFD